MCGPQLITDETRDKIVALRAEPGTVSTSPFGPDDDIGMLNLLTEDGVASCLRRARGGHVYDLSVDLFMGMPTWTAGGEPPYQIWMSHTPRGTVVDDPLGVGREHNEHVSWSADSISMFTHCGTHLDTLNHFGYDNKIWNGFDADRHLGTSHWLVGGPDKQPPIIARGVLLDVAGVHGVETLDDSFPIDEDVLRETVAAHGVQIGVGDVVLIRTGRMATWPDPALYLPREPGLTRGGAEYLARSGAMVIGADTVALEQLPSPDPHNWAPVHTYLLAEAGIPIIEVAYLEELASDGCHEFVFIGAGLRLRGATSGPMRPLAIPM